MMANAASHEANDGPPPACFETLDALYAALERTDTAPQAGFSEQLVRGEGAARPSLMLVGEQPGHEEDLAGRPFVGPAGRLLDSCLEEAGIERDETFVTNAVKRFKFSLRGKRRLHQTPNAGDIAHYRWWLGEEIRLVDPAVIVALGTTALHALLGKRTTLRSVRGEELDWNKRPLRGTVHPSYLLRLRGKDARETERARFVADLREAAQAA